MNSNHTPGPWSISPRGGAVVSASPIPDVPANTGHSDIDHYGGFLICESVWRKEDARLIASAPDIFEALLRAERKLSAYIGVCSGDKELTDAILPMVRTALAKARGAA